MGVLIFVLSIYMCVSIRIHTHIPTFISNNFALSYIKQPRVISNHDFYFLKQSIKSKLSIIIFFNRALWAKEIIGFFSPCSQKISIYRIILKNKDIHFTLNFI